MGREYILESDTFTCLWIPAPSYSLWSWRNHLTAIDLNFLTCFLVLCCFFYGCTHSTWKFPGQGLNLRHSCDPYCSCSNTGLFSPLYQARNQTQAVAVGFLTHCITRTVFFCFLFFFFKQKVSDAKKTFSPLPSAPLSADIWIDS